MYESDVEDRSMLKIQKSQQCHNAQAQTQAGWAYRQNKK